MQETSIEVKVRNRDIISSLFWMAIGIGVCYGGYDHGLGTIRDPGGGFIFFWVGIIIIGLSLGILLRAMREKPVKGEMKVFYAGIQWKKIIAVLSVLFIYAAVFIPLGFILSTIFLLTFLFKAVEPQRWSWAILGAIVSTLAAYGLFQLWLGCQFPQGLLGI